MKTKSGITTVIFYMITGVLFAQNQNQQKVSINSLLEKVAVHSKEIKIAEHELEKSFLDVADAQNNKLPDISVNASVDKATNFPIYDSGLFEKPSQHDVIHTLYATNANFYLSIYEGLKKKNTVKLKEIEASLQKELFLETEATVKLQAVHLFLDLFLQDELRATLLADMKEKEHQLKEIKDLFDLGVILQSDVLRAELELSKRKMTLIEIENQRTKINQKLNVLIGNQDEQWVQPIFDTDSLPKLPLFSEALQQATTNAYAEKQSHFHVLAVEKNLELVKANNNVKIGLTGSFQFSNPQIFLYPYNDAWYHLGLVGIKASYSLSELYKNKNKKKIAKEAIEQAHMHHEKINDDVRTALYKEYLSFDEALKYVDVFKLNTKYAAENERILKDAYFNQTALITDLLDANVLVVKSNFELIQAQVNVFKNYYQLQFTQGTL